jgi:hypothetical protein
MEYLDADELNAVAAGTKAAANAVAIKSAVEKWLAKSLHRVATENEQRRQLAVAEASASPIPLSAAHSQLQTPQGAQALGALKLDLESDVDNGSLRVFKHERQSSSGKEQAENESDEDESGKSARAIKLATTRDRGRQHPAHGQGSQAELHQGSEAGYPIATDFQ